MTVNLTRRGVESLDKICVHEDLNKTDAVDRSLKLHAFVLDEFDEGKELAFIDTEGNVQKVRLL